MELEGFKPLDPATSIAQTPWRGEEINKSCPVAWFKDRKLTHPPLATRGCPDMRLLAAILAASAVG